jgi:LAO/AO transport system kinase
MALRCPALSRRNSQKAAQGITEIEQTMFTIDHLGIAVKSLAAAKGIYEKLGLSISAEEVVDAEQVRLVMVPLGESRLELLTPHLLARSRPGRRG